MSDSIYRKLTTLVEIVTLKTRVLCVIDAVGFPHLSSLAVATTLSPHERQYLIPLLILQELYFCSIPENAKHTLSLLHFHIKHTGSSPPHKEVRLVRPVNTGDGCVQTWRVETIRRPQHREIIETSQGLLEKTLHQLMKMIT